MKEIEKAYIAGLIDGEGCIRIAKQTRGPAKNYYPHLQVAMCDIEALEYMSTTMGLKILGPYNYSPTRKPFYIVNAFGRKAIELIKCILPYLHVKKNVAEAVIPFPIGRTGKRLSKETKKLQEDIYLTTRMLNQRKH